MATTLLLLCAGATRSARQGGFAARDEGLDMRGRQDAAAVRLPPRWRGAVVRSPWRAAVETVAAMGLADDAVSSEAALADIDHGAWAGRSFADIEAAEPGALGAWLADPAVGTSGGETMANAAARIGEWLDGLAGGSRTLCAVTHPMMIRAALAHALALPLATTLAIDVAPLSQVRLSFHGKWRLQALGRVMLDT